MRTVLPSPVAASAWPSGSDRRRLLRILSSPQFHPQTSPLDVFHRLLATITRDVSIWLGQELASTPQAFGAVGLIIVLAVIVAALLVLRGTARSPFRETAILPALGRPMTAWDARDQARRSADAGEWREAVHFLLISVLVQLEANGRLEVQPHLTNREYLDRLRSSPSPRGPAAGSPPSCGALAAVASGAVLSPFEELVEIVDGVWYGHHPLDETTYARAQQLADAAVAPEALRFAA